MSKIEVDKDSSLQKKPSKNIKQYYEELVATHILLPDDVQKKQIDVFYDMQHTFSLYALSFKHPFLQKILKRKSRTRPSHLYLYGDVGRGKSMLMDLFYNTLSTTHKARFHFHDFMQKNHGILHELRKELGNPSLKKKSHALIYETWIKKIAQSMLILCLDELQVTDIADAMIIERLFKGLEEAGVVIVVTSNRIPESLYENGLQRELFLPFIQIIREKWKVISLDAHQDYRLNRLKNIQETYITSNNVEENLKELKKIFTQLSHESHIIPYILKVQGRSLSFETTSNGVVLVDFHQLCELPLGAADYSALALTFHTVILSNIPQFVDEKRNEARRFITLIDILYDHNIKFISSAEVPPEDLCKIDLFEFHRTVSRLNEMQSVSYWEKPIIRASST